MIKLFGIKKSYGGQVLFDDLSFNVNRRERVGLVGRNGHGKTTLFRIILGEEDCDAGQVMRPRRYRIGHLDQHLTFTEASVLEEACLGLPDTLKGQQWRAEKILSGLGFRDADMELPPELFSGGYQVRLNLAKVLVSEPDLLLLDEPTNYLDVVSIRWLSRFLRSWRHEMILITHDRSFMDSVVTHTVAIHRRKAKKIEGRTDKLYAQILQEEEIYEKTRLNDEKKRQEIERFITRFRAKNTLATRVQSRIKYLASHEKLDKLDRIQTLDFSFNDTPFPAKVAMRAEHLSFGYGDDADLFTDLSFEVQHHDRLCIMGQNGKGKSTLLRLLAGGLEPRAGQIHPHPKLALGHFDQTNIDTLNPHNTVVEEILSADGGCLPQAARNIAGAMMFEGDHALKKVAVLSGGEKSRVMLGRLLVTPANLLLLDEPTNHLDMDSCDALLAAVDAFGGAVIIVTHNEMFLHSLATRFIVFDRDRVHVFNGTYQEFLDEIGWELDERLGARKTAPLPTRTDKAKKELRQARAKIQQERSRILAPLQKRVDDLEARIVNAEAESKIVLESINDAAISGDMTNMPELSKRSSELLQDIEYLFSLLEATTTQLETATTEFEDRLKKLD